MMELTWSHDFCLACDRQTSGSAYCSQSCRLADLQSSSAHSSPQTSPSSSSFPKSPASSSATGFYLSPAIDWASYKTPHSGHRPSSMTTTAPKPGGTGARVLSPSNSNSSLDSGKSTAAAAAAPQSATKFNDKIHTQLRDYTNSFDTSRNRSRGWSS